MKRNEHLVNGMTRNVLHLFFVRADKKVYGKISGRMWHQLLKGGTR